MSGIRGHVEAEVPTLHLPDGNRKCLPRFCAPRSSPHSPVPWHWYGGLFLTLEEVVQFPGSQAQEAF